MHGKKYLHLYGLYCTPYTLYIFCARFPVFWPTLGSRLTLWSGAFAPVFGNPHAPWNNHIPSWVSMCNTVGVFSSPQGYIHIPRPVYFYPPGYFPGVFRSPLLNGSLGRWVLSYTQCLITTERCTPRHIDMPSLVERVYQVGVYVSYTDCPFPDTHFGIHLMNVKSGKIASTYEFVT